LEFDHLFVCTSRGAPEADELVRAGFAEGTPNAHAGQGTACRRFFFRNAYLELLWVRDEAEARGAPAERTRLWERSRAAETGYSPFGVALRSPSDGETDDLPFETWAYRPAFLPAPLHVDVAESRTPAEPLVFRIPGRRPDAYDAARAQPLAHDSGAREITSIAITLAHAADSPALEAVERAGVVTFRQGLLPLAEVVFDGGRHGLGIDLRPGLPLVLRW
jgi:hypothetical protein